MRTLLSLAAVAFALGLALPAPAQAFDDSLPHYAPYRYHTYVHHHARGRRPVHAHVAHECRRWTWREHCHPYKLGGFFERRYDYRRVRWFR